MFGLILRLGFFFALIFGVMYGLSRLWRGRARDRAVREIRSDVTALGSGLEEGLYDDHEARALTARIYEACEREGIPIELPWAPEEGQGHSADLPDEQREARIERRVDR